jgi:L-rhamnonate dehydratase
MNRRTFFSTGLVGAAAAQPPDPGKSRMKIASVRLVNTRPKRPVPRYTPAPGSWGTQNVEVANPMSIYPEYKATRSLFMPDAGKVPSFTVEISHGQRDQGLRQRRPGGGVVVVEHLTKLLKGEDPFNIERIWDICWRSTMHYGRMGVVMNAISGVDQAVWDIVGKALGMPVYKLLGGETKPQIPIYCTGNDIEQHVEHGFRMLKLAIPHGPPAAGKACAKTRLW